MDRHNSQPEQTDSGADRGSTARDCQNRRIVRLEADMPLSGWRIAPAHDREWVDRRLVAFGRPTSKSCYLMPMSLDHIVCKSPHRSRLVGQLSTDHGFQVLPGFRWNDQLLSEGVRFSNGPFIDVFDWPQMKAPFEPLLAIEADLASAEIAARKQGWSLHVSMRHQAPVAERPPWSILSFSRGQGFVSSLFIIEYDDSPDAWQNEQFCGLLYRRSNEHESAAELASIEVLTADASTSLAQLDKLGLAPIPLLNFKSAQAATDHIGAIHYRDFDGGSHSLLL